MTFEQWAEQTQLAASRALQHREELELLRAVWNGGYACGYEVGYNKGLAYQGVKD